MWYSVCILYISSFENSKGIEVKRESPSLNDLNNESSGKKGATASAPSIRCLWLHRLQKFASFECQTWFDQKHIPTAKYQRGEKKAESKKYSCLRHLNIVAVKRKKEEWAFLSPFSENKKRTLRSLNIPSFFCFCFWFFYLNCSFLTLHVCN